MARPKKLENQSLEELQATAEARGLPTNGSQEELKARLITDETNKGDYNTLENSDVIEIDGVDADTELDTSPKTNPALQANYDRNKARQDQIVENVLPEYKGSGLGVHFDKDGSVTFKRGNHAESIHTSASDEAIRQCIRRVVGIKINAANAGNAEADLNYAW